MKTIFDKIYQAFLIYLPAVFTNNFPVSARILRSFQAVV